MKKTLGRVMRRKIAKNIQIAQSATKSLQQRIVSTRSNASEDARRDFDHFDENEELSRLREAMRRGQWRVATELASNLDAHLSRGGSLPVAWLGPTCMQEPGNLDARREDSLENAAKMSQQQRQDAIWGYVEVLPESEAR
jgi:hypothetical protein